ncbi:MAG: hypothetical protein PHC64_10110 [Candidatus Gastranaerophilales bacterium]|nr:hypothetical protein [Candidatus Gastranaerophilales bacterium]
MKDINIKNYIKSLLALKCITITQLAKMMSERTEKKYTFSSLSQKMSRGSLSLKESFLIADLIGYELKFEPKNK